MLSNAFTLVILTFLSLVSLVAGLSEFIDVDPQTLLVNEKTFRMEQLNLKMKTKPYGSVVLSFSTSRGLTLSTCNLKFDARSYKNPLVLFVSRGIAPAIYPPPKIDEAIKVAAYARQDRRIHGKTMLIRVKSRSNKRGVCNTMSRTAFNTFDGLVNYAKSSGWINMVQSRGFSLSVYQARCRSKGYCIKRAVMLFQNKAVGIFNLDSYYSAGKLKMINNYGLVRVHRLRNHGFMLRTKDGMLIVIRYNREDASIYVNAPASYAGKTRGICGNFDGIKWNDRYPLHSALLDRHSAREIETLFADRQSSRAILSKAQEIYGQQTSAQTNFRRYFYLKQCDGRIRHF